MFSLVSSLSSCSEAARPRAPDSTRCSRGRCQLREKYFYLNFCICYVLNWHLWNVLEFNTLSGSCWMCPSRKFLQNNGSLNPTCWLREFTDSFRMETAVQIIESCLMFTLIAFDVAFNVNPQQWLTLCDRCRGHRGVSLSQQQQQHRCCTQVGNAGPLPAGSRAQLSGGAIPVGLL